MLPLTLIPKLKAAAVAAAVLVLACAGSFWWGWDKRGDQAQVERAALVLEQQERRAALDESLAKADHARQIEEQRYVQAENRYHDALRRGAVRLSIPTRPVEPAASAPAGDVPEARAELDPEAAVRIDRIANEGDAAIRDLNALIDWYNEVRARLSKGN